VALGRSPVVSLSTEDIQQVQRDPHGTVFQDIKKQDLTQFLAKNKL
jgi:hypothetical protein